MNYQDIFRQFPLPLCVIDPSGALLGYNTAFSTLVGRPGEDLRGHALSEFFTAAEQPAAPLEEVISRNTTCKLNQHPKTPGEGLKTIRCHKTQLSEQKNVLLYFTATAPVAGDPKLSPDQRMKIFGYLAPGIAHNINNPLAVILGRAQLMQAQKPDHPGANVILSQAEKIQSLLNTITFLSSSEIEAEESVVDLAGLLKKILILLDADPFFKHKVEKEIEIQEGVPGIRGIFSDFSQGIMCFLNYSIDSMLDTEKKNLALQLYNDEHHIYLHIIDSGRKIPAEKIDSLFQRQPEKTVSDRLGRFDTNIYNAYRLLSNYEVDVKLRNIEKHGKIISLEFSY